jgi:hypothetical protein
LVHSFERLVRAAGARRVGQNMGWVDAHSHIWTRDTARYPLREGLDPEDVVATRTPAHTSARNSSSPVHISSTASSS